MREEGCKGWLFLLLPQSWEHTELSGRASSKGSQGETYQRGVLGAGCTTQGACEIVRYLFITIVEVGTASTCAFEFLTLGKDVVLEFGDDAARGWYQNSTWDFPSGTVVKNPPVNAGDVGLIPGAGRPHMPQSN